MVSARSSTPGSGWQRKSLGPSIATFRVALVLSFILFSCIRSFSGSKLQWDCHEQELNHQPPVINITAASTKPTETSSSSSFQLAYEESLCFFNDISNTEWSRMKQRVAEVQPNFCSYCRGRTFAPAWFQNHYEPDFTCRHERRVGRLGDGGKWMCDPHLIPPKDCLVYSVGSNGEFSFETSVKQVVGQDCEVHTFDMRNYSEGAIKAGSNYHQWGISERAFTNGRGTFKTLAQTVKELGHEGRVIDVFKIDCEGCEWSSGKSWFQANVMLRQILVELHSGPEDQMPMPFAINFFQEMYRQDYVIFHKEPNIHYSRYGWAVEYAFLKLNHTFFKDMPTIVK